MQKGLFLYLDREISLEHKKRATISLGESSFIRKESLQHPSEVSPPNIKDIKRCLVKKSRKDYLDTPFGITPSNYSQEHPPRYLDDSFPSPKVKFPKHKSS